MQPRIEALDFDEANDRELARHHVSANEIRQVFASRPVFIPNKRGRAAQLVMIGATYGGRFLTVPIAATDRAGTWRPVTGWDSTASEIARYRAVRRR